ncbi:MAG: DEAD/DEAH box helicase [Chloroflexi bacterium]|nr:DEAD/DEAH box helicase [Chloroflexota bacterium]
MGYPHPRRLKTCGYTPPANQASPENLTVLLPSAGGRPLPSDELRRFAADETPDAREKPAVELSPWQIPTLALPPGPALHFLFALPGRPPRGAVFGNSLRFWAEASKLAIELIARQCFLPAIKSDSGNGHQEFRAAWEAVIEGKDLERLQLLAGAMPPCCLAIVRPDKETVQPAGLLRTFLDQTIDGFVRRAAAQIPLSPPLKKGDEGGLKRDKGGLRRTSPPAAHWVQALVSQAPFLTIPSPEMDSFSKEVEAWTGQVGPPAAETALRTCFRLEPPEESREWKVSFHLQAREDPSLLVPAAKVWQSRSGVITLLKRRFENPQERLLADLGKALRVFPRLEDSLKTACPVEVGLDVKSAYQFLRQSAPLLEQSGFGVLLPGWWQKPAARLGVKLTLRPKDKTKKTASGLLGRDAIVAYEWELALGDDSLSREEFEKLAKLKVPLVKVRGQWVELNPEEIERAMAFFAKHGADGDMGLAQAVRMGLGQETSELGLPVTGVGMEGWLKDFMQTQSDTARMPVIAAPPGFNGQLRPYQLLGVSWLAFLRQFGFGACLADDMGLGKTIEFIAFLLHLRQRKLLRGPSLLVCPMSVVNNWKREVERFAPSLKIMVHHGPDRDSGDSLVGLVKKNQLVITTYALAHRDAATLSRVDWECVALDEAQNIKNPSARQTQAVRKLKADYRVALTGTPVENSLSELWSVMEFLNPGYLGSAQDFHTNLAAPIEKFHSQAHTERLKRLIQPFVLRRVKTDKTIISDLPEKIETKVFCNLTREQATLYEAVVREMMEKIEESEGMQRKGLVLATLSKLKQVCNHPAQFLQDRSSLTGRSGKLLRLDEMLEEILAEGDRALIFTQFAAMGGMLKDYLQETFAREALFLHGGTARPERDDMVRRFQDDHRGPPLFILSLKAGGFGLNLTAANHVFHFDRWWNPAVENQATDRVFRIGQKRNVQVHKFVCLGTVEEHIDEMMEKKRELAQSIVGAGEAWLTEMSTRQLREVFALSRQAVED